MFTKEKYEELKAQKTEQIFTVCYSCVYKHGKKDAWINSIKAYFGVFLSNTEAEQHRKDKFGDCLSDTKVVSMSLNEMKSLI